MSIASISTYFLLDPVKLGSILFLMLHVLYLGQPSSLGGLGEFSHAARGKALIRNDDDHLLNLKILILVCRGLIILHFSMIFAVVYVHQALKIN